MPHNSGPVQLQAPIDLLDPCNRSIQLSDTFHRAVGKRRIFVQTDCGDVVGVEVERGDKADKVKKTVQAALRVPTDQSELIFAGHVLEDLSEIRKDSSVLLTRGVHRSCSTPSLCPMALENHIPMNEQTKPFEAVGGVRCTPQAQNIIREVIKALNLGIEPMRATGGLGGAYYFKNRRGECTAIVKPTDEEPFAPNNPNGYVGRSLGQPGLKRAIRVGEAGPREVAAYILDHDGFASVPHTALVKGSHSIFNLNGNSGGVNGNNSRNTVKFEKLSSKIASFQQYVDHDFDASEHGTSRFPVSSVHRIGILDVRIFNTDRHSGNILIKRLPQDEFIPSKSSSLQFDEHVALIPIDHGFCLPETLESAYFEWLHWPQASMPFTQEELEYIRSLDPDKDVEELMTHLPVLREGCYRILKLSTSLLKSCAEAAFTLADIGGMMSRDLSGMDEEASEFENLCFLSKRRLDEEEMRKNCVSMSSSDKSCNKQDMAEKGVESEEEFDEKEEISLSPLQFDLDNEEDAGLFALSQGRGLSFNEQEDDYDHDDMISNFQEKINLSCGSSSMSSMHPNPLSFSSSYGKSASPDVPSPVTVHGFEISSTIPSHNSKFNCSDSIDFGPLSCSLSTKLNPSSSKFLFHQRSFSTNPSVKLHKPCFSRLQFSETCTDTSNKEAIGLKHSSFENDDTITVDDTASVNRSLDLEETDSTAPFSVPQIVNSIDFSDMPEKSWLRFYDIFCELLDEMIRKKCRGSSNMMRISQRYGMSCQF